MEKEKKQQDKSPKKKEKLSEKDLRELMDIDKPTYYKKNGAWRSK